MAEEKLTIVLAADHAGYKLKEAVKAYLESQKIQVLDVGAHEYDAGDDYPPYMAAAAMKVASDLKGHTKAVIAGGSGEGEAMVANRFPGVRAVAWYGDKLDIVQLSREHNDANILSMGGRFVSEELAVKAVELWLKTPFSGDERHKRRIQEMDNIQ
ncbi:MAG: ribose-5-phosphate isomerase ribose 5-phosphate isomerase [Candidatus Parcubacteria bacterium]|nr:ribose-5-phosphate isomerase ribose 5-phosphate isomerase [Candidatus Parcubacteria bacterium]